MKDTHSRKLHTPGNGVHACAPGAHPDDNGMLQYGYAGAKEPLIKSSMSRFICFLLPAVLILQAHVARAESQIATEAWCAYLVERLHSVSENSCHPQDFVAAEEPTVQGNALVLRDFGAAKDEMSPEIAKRVLLIGGIHGDELTSISIVFRWMEWISQSDAAQYHWRVIPLANPDGLKASPSTRINANGVDINRNFQTPDWDKDAQRYWIKRTHRDPRRYPGSAAGSEIETRWLQAQIDEFQPDIIISVHAPYNLLDYDGPVPQPMRFGRLSLTRLGVYPGSLGNYGGLFKQVPVVTIELPNGTVMPAQHDQRVMWKDMLKWMKNNISILAGKPLPEKKAEARIVLPEVGNSLRLGYMP